MVYAPDRGCHAHGSMGHGAPEFAVVAALSSLEIINSFYALYLKFKLMPQVQFLSFGQA